MTPKFTAAPQQTTLLGWPINATQYLSYETRYYLDDDPQLNFPARNQFFDSLSPALRLQSDTQSCLFYFLSVSQSH